MGIFEEAAIFRGVTKEDARQMLNCLNPVEKTYKKMKSFTMPGMRLLRWRGSFRQRVH